MGQLICLDVDNTLQGPLGEVSEPRIHRIIQEIQEAGNIICLHSDTSTARLKGIAKKFGITGPLFGERGQVACFDQGVPKVLCYGLERTFVEIKRLLHEYIDVVFRQKANVHHLWRTPEDLSHAQSLVRPRQATIACYYMRLVSLSFCIFNHGHEKDPTTDPLFQLFCERLQRFIRNYKFDNLVVETHPGTHYIQLISSSANKGSVVDELLDRYNLQKMYMVGDSPTDYLKDPRVIQFAVGNAQQTYKDVCEYVAEEEFSAGTYACLKRIMQQNAH